MMDIGIKFNVAIHLQRDDMNVETPMPLVVSSLVTNKAIAVSFLRNEDVI